MSPILPAAVTALMLACAAPALGAEPQPSVAIRYDDLNTAAPAGVEALLRRVDQATLVVCGGRPDLKAIADFQRFTACRAETRQRVVAQLGQPLLLAALANHPADR